MKINVYRCDICGAHSYEKQGNSIIYIAHGERKAIEHICDDCICAFESFLSQMDNLEEEKIAFVKVDPEKD